MKASLRSPKHSTYEGTCANMTQQWQHTPHTTAAITKKGVGQCSAGLSGNKITWAWVVCECKGAAGRPRYKVYKTLDSASSADAFLGVQAVRAGRSGAWQKLELLTCIVEWRKLAESTKIFADTPAGTRSSRSVAPTRRVFTALRFGRLEWNIPAATQSFLRCCVIG